MAESRPWSGSGAQGRTGRKVGLKTPLGIYPVGLHVIHTVCLFRIVIHPVGLSSIFEHM